MCRPRVHNWGKRQLRISLLQIRVHGLAMKRQEASAFCHWPVDVQDLNSPAAVDLKVDPRPTLLFMEKSSHGLEIDRVRPPLLQGPACRYRAHEV